MSKELILLLIETLSFVLALKFTLNYIGTLTTYLKTNIVNDKFASIKACIMWGSYYFIIHN